MDINKHGLQYKNMRITCNKNYKAHMGILKYKLGKREILVIYNVKSTMNIEHKNIQQGICIGMAIMLNSFGQGDFLARD